MAEETPKSLIPHWDGDQTTWPQYERSVRVYVDGTKGHRCANAHDPKKWFCLGKLQTDSCIEGYVCTGAPNYKCELSGKPGEGTPDAHACIDGCAKPPKWKCNSGENKCEVCTEAERDINPSCMDNVDTCNDKCIVAKTYKCDHSKAQCTECKTGPGGDDPSVCKGKDECDGTCSASFHRVPDMEKDLSTMMP